MYMYVYIFHFLYSTWLLIFCKFCHVITSVKIGGANYSVAAGFYKEFIRTININTYLRVILNFIYQI